MLREGRVKGSKALLPGAWGCPQTITSSLGREGRSSLSSTLLWAGIGDSELVALRDQHVRVQERGDRGADQRSGPVHPGVGPCAIDECWAERARRVHGSAG